MCHRITLLTYFAIVWSIISITIGQQEGVFETPPQCLNQEKGNQEKCVKNYCLLNQGKFLCKSLKCKTDHPGSGIADNMGKLSCINDVCESYPSQHACKKLQECEAKKKQGLTGIFAYVECVIKLFSENK